MTMCSSWISNPLNRIGTVARVAIQARTRARRSRAYSISAMARPIRCWVIMTRVKLCSGSSALRYSE